MARAIEREYEISPSDARNGTPIKVAARKRKRDKAKEKVSRKLAVRRGRDKGEEAGEDVGVAERGYGAEETGDGA